MNSSPWEGEKSIGAVFRGHPPYLLNILGQTRPELVEGRWFRQAQPTSLIIEKMPSVHEKRPLTGSPHLDARVARAGNLPNCNP